MEKKAAASPGDCLAMDLHLISEFDGTSQEVVEWLVKLELVCKLRDTTELHTVVPLRLTGGAFAVYQQLSSPDKEKYEKIKVALVSAFAADKFVAYEQFVARRLREGESVDVYLANLLRLAELFGGMTDSGLSCAFVAGLPESPRDILRAGSRLELLNRARAVLADEHPGDGASTPLSYGGHYTAAPATSSVVRCLACNQPNHYARNCLAGRGGRGRRAVFHMWAARSRFYHVFGNRVRRRGTSASLRSKPLVKLKWIPAVRGLLRTCPCVPNGLEEMLV